jgi:hypothetical protein
MRGVSAAPKRLETKEPNMQSRWKLASFLVVSLLFVNGIVAAPPTDGRANSERAFESAGRSPAETAAFFKHAFKNTSLDDLREFRASPFPGVSIRAAWETVVRTTPEKPTERPAQVERAALEWFLGFIEGRTRISPPVEWQQLLQTARAHSRSNVTFGINTDNWGYRQIGAGFRGPPGATIRSTEADFELTTNGSSVHVSKNLLADKRWVSSTVNDGKLYLAPHQDFCMPYKLFCLDVATGKLQWESPVWAAGGLVNYEGTGGHSVRVTIAGDAVVLFGVGADAAYIESFRASDGAVLFRFSSSL